MNWWELDSDEAKLQALLSDKYSGDDFEDAFQLVDTDYDNGKLNRLWLPDNTFDVSFDVSLSDFLFFENLYYLSVDDLNLNHSNESFEKSSISFLITKTSNISMIPSGLLEKLYFLDLSGSNLSKDLHTKIILIELNTLILDNTGIKNINPALFDMLPNIGELHLNGNMISEIDPLWFEKMTNIGGIELNNNQIVEIPEDLFSKCTKLRNISLDGNPISNLPDNFFDQLPNLERLSMNNCNITKIDFDLFDKCPKLNYISFYDTKLPEIIRTEYGHYYGGHTINDLREILGRVKYLN